MAKVDTIVVGYRDDDGTVKSLEELKVKDIPKRAKVRLWRSQNISSLYYFKYPIFRAGVRLDA